MSTRDLVTAKLVWDTLKADKGDTARLDSYKVVDFTSKGDNYSCYVTSLAVKYTEGEEKQETTYVAKITLSIFKQADSTMVDMMHHIFYKESTCYFEIIPKINKVLRENELQDLSVAKGYAKNLKKSEDIIILEDLRRRGFKMFDRQRGMDVAHATLVLKELGRLHAASHALERTLPGHRFSNVWPCLKENWMSDDNLKQLIQGMLGGQMEAAALIVEKIPDYEHVVKWLRKIKGDVSDIFIEALDPETKFAVLTHGDCWNNNLLFRYDKAGAPVEVMLVDLQGMRRASAASDLGYFLYSSFNGSERKDNVKMFLKIYHKSFSSVLKAAKVPVPFSYLELYLEFRRKMIFGLISGLFLIPVVLSEAEDIPDFESFDKEHIKKFNEERQVTIMRMSERKDGLLRTRVLDMFDEMIEAGIMPQSQ